FPVSSVGNSRPACCLASSTHSEGETMDLFFAQPNVQWHESISSEEGLNAPGLFAHSMSGASEFYSSWLPIPEMSFPVTLTGARPILYLLGTRTHLLQAFQSVQAQAQLINIERRRNGCQLGISIWTGLRAATKDRTLSFFYRAKRQEAFKG